MNIAMPVLPYAVNALEPVISEQTINFHYGKHLQNYVNTLASLVKDTELADKSVEEIVAVAPEGPIFNNAGQVLDRKSTRLNSSHANISYAVFCLKKKNTTM